MEGGSGHCTGGSDQDQPQGEKKCKKAKWLSEEGLQIAEKRREAKDTGEKERYTYLKSSREQQGKIRKPSSAINAKK